MTAQFEPDMAERYARAARLMQGVFTKSVAFNTTVCPVWIGDSDRFWYVRETAHGDAYRLVDPAHGTNVAAFDQPALARALETALGRPVDPDNLGLKNVEIAEDPLTLTFSIGDASFRFDAAAGSCAPVERLDTKELASPDGRLVLFRRDHNLWLREAGTGKERALTSDGSKDYAYGAAGSCWGWEAAGGVQAAWSPDGARIFTVVRDKREVDEMPVVNFAPKSGAPRPEWRFTRVALPGDAHAESYRPLVIDVDTGERRAADHPPLISTRSNWYFFDGRNGWWAPDSRRAYFVDIDRYHKWVRVVVFDTDTGACRAVFEERSDTHVNLMLSGTHPAFLPLPETDEILWYSERTGAAQYDLYDLATGALKHVVTSGPGLVRNWVRLAAERRELFVQTAGRVPGRNPYYRDLARVDIDTGEMREVAGGDMEIVTICGPGETTTGGLRALGCPLSASGVSPSGRYAVVTASRADLTPESYVVDRAGVRVMDLETADVSGLPANWRWPEPVSVTAADRSTEIWGVVYRPSDFDESRSYPVISLGFHQPEYAATPRGSFTNGIGAGRYYLTGAALAELGFIVVQLDGRGGPEREKAFFDASYGRVELASCIDDHVAGIRELARRHPYMDLDRVGVAAILSGGSSAVEGMLKHPEFFKVGVSLCHHDSRSMGSTLWADEYEGERAVSPDRAFSEAYADRLEGKLLLIHGLLDDAVFPTATFRLVEALQAANKDFDQIILPNYAHAGPEYGYLLRRSWDYLVRGLMGAELPKDFAMPPLFQRHTFLKEKAKAAAES